MKAKTEYNGLEVAVVGMAGQLPGAEDLDTFWSNLIKGKESISHFSDEELMEVGIDRETLSMPNFVKAKGVFPKLEQFDADFFNYTPKDAATMDPQVRALHEGVYHALEDAGYAAENTRNNTGVFLGATNNFSWEYETMKKTLETNDHHFATAQLNDKDFASTRISYSLNLHGPSVTVHSACSTSLYAIDMAYRYLITGGCSLAVAGGSGLTIPSRDGYFVMDGRINSPDGHCRPFDEDARGTVEGNGQGIVVLKRLEDAMRDRDRIYAVIRGTATNNDGNRKVGYTSPSVDGQVDVIKQSLVMADTPANTISYIEAHGTGTILGDPIEVAALQKVFQSAPPNSCGIGSLKSNIGHLDVAAGVSSFIKTALALENKMIPASINFNKINSQIDIENSPFHIVTENKTWERQKVDGRENEYMPLRAGVSSYGIGGTNVHVVLEEAPKREPSGPGRDWNILTLSAHTDGALQRLKENYLEYLKGPGANLDPSDLAWSLQTGPRNLEKRFTMAFRDIEHVVEGLSSNLEGVQPLSGQNLTAPIGKPSIYFLFPGHGSQYPGMAKDLYEKESTFRKHLDECLEIVEKNRLNDLRRILLNPVDGDEAKLNETELSQLALFIVEYSLARLLMNWGIQPSGLIGHSLGEYTSACLSGVFSLEEGIHLIQARGQLINSMPLGSMLSVNTSAENVESFLSEELSLSAVNSPDKCTVSGSSEAIDMLKKKLFENNILSIKLDTTHAFHSHLMEGAMEPYRQAFNGIRLKSPQIPYISNYTGDWMTEQEATNPYHYGNHLRGCVKFKNGIEKILADERAILIEVGPGRILSAFARQTSTKPIEVVNMLRDPQESISDDMLLVESLGELWGKGVSLNWKAYYKGQVRNRVPLPLYPFEPTVFPIGKGITMETFLSPGKDPGSSGKLDNTDSKMNENQENSVEMQLAVAEEEALVDVTADSSQELLGHSAVEKVQVLLKTIWCKLFGYEDIDMDATFFELGGDSFKLIQMTVDLEREGYRVLMNEVYEYPTIRSLSHYIVEELQHKLPEDITKEEIEKKISEAIGTTCRLLILDEEEPMNVLFVDTESAEGIDNIRRQLINFKLPKEQLPHYILPFSVAEGLAESIGVQELVQLGAMSHSEQSTVETIKKWLPTAQEEYNNAVVSQPVTERYGLSNVQKIHFKGEVRLQLYLIEFEEMMDEEKLQQAFCEVVGSHGLLRSCLYKRFWQFRWEEHAPPVKAPIPRLDLSGLTPDAQSRVMDVLAKEEWGADFKITGKPMYHVMLIKLNEQHYQLFFQFDHSIIDLSSGQIIRRQLIQRYKELLKGSKKRMKASTSYQEYLKQVYRGPKGINADELISHLAIKEYGEYTEVANKKIRDRPSGRIQQLRLDVDLSSFEFEGGEEEGPFNVALQVYILAISRLLKLDAVPFDLLYVNRRYQNRNYSDVVGLVLDSVPFLIPVERENPNKMIQLIKERIQFINKHNVNFLNLIYNLRSWWRWRKVVSAGKKDKSKLYSPFLLNYVGNVEEEYDKIWDLSLAQLDDDDQSKLNYGDFYGLVKVMDNKLNFLILCNFETDMERVKQVFDEEMNHLLKLRKEKSGIK